MGDEKGSKILTWYQSQPSVWIMLEKAPHLSSSRRTEKRKRKSRLRVRGSVESPTLTGHGPIEVNIYKRTFLPLQVLLVGDERGSKILTNINAW